MPFTLMDPTGSANVPKFSTARRIGDMSGIRVGLLENGKTNAEKFLTMVGELLVSRYGAASYGIFSKETFSKPASPDLIAELVKSSDIGVTGIGD